MRLLLFFLLAAGVWSASLAAMGSKSGVVQRGDYLRRADVQTFITSLVDRHDFSSEELQRVIGQGSKSQRIIDLISLPAESKPWHEYRGIFLTDKRIDAGVKFWQEHSDTLLRAEQLYGVPSEIIVAIIGVETFYGTRMGTFPVLDALLTLGFDYPPRSDFFRSELEQFYLLCREESLDPLKPVGSYAGAMGMGQFIPSSYRNFAVDFDGNGKRDLWQSPEDAIGSVGHYFMQHGWVPEKTVISPATFKGDGYAEIADGQLKPKFLVADLKKAGISAGGPFEKDELLSVVVLEQKNGPELWVGHQNFYVITRYNHSEKYAMAVYLLSRAIRDAYQQPRTEKEA